MKTTFLSGIMCLAMAGTKEGPPLKTYSLLVRVPVGYSSEQAKAVGPQWDAALKKWKEAGAYLLSFAFPGESYVLSGPANSIKKEAVIADNLRVVSNIVLHANSIEAALELAKDCPVLAYGGSVEVREIPNGVPLPSP